VKNWTNPSERRRVTFNHPHVPSVNGTATVEVHCGKFAPVEDTNSWRKPVVVIRNIQPRWLPVSAQCATNVWIVVRVQSVAIA
jgi:hypothetical protein